MNALEFLEALWPDEGHYVLAIPFTPAGAKKPLFAHKVFDTIPEAVEHVSKVRLTKDVFFGVLTLKEPRLWNPSKIDYKTGEPGAYEVRTHKNILAAKTLFLDLDVGSDPKKFASLAEAIADLKQFVKTAGLPKPMVVRSGSGAHVYWPMADTISVGRWVTMAAQLKQLSLAHGLRVDPSRTTDRASVLRVATTFNHKDPENLLKVKVLTPGDVTAPDELESLLRTALIRAGEDMPSITDMPPRNVSDDDLGSNTEKTYDGPPVKAKAVVRACFQFQRMVARNFDIPEPEWYAALQVLRLCHEGEAVAHRLSSKSPTYDYDTTQARLDNLSSRNVGPAMCRTIADKCGPALCKACPHWYRDSTPLVIARNYSRPKPLLVPDHSAEQEPGESKTPEKELPELEGRYRLTEERVVRHDTSKDNEEFATSVLEYLMRPRQRLVDRVREQEFVEWVAEVPREKEPRVFTVSSHELYRPEMLLSGLTNRGLYASPSVVRDVQEFMVAYVQLLQRTFDGTETYNTLGWHDEHQTFVLPEKTLKRDGTAVTSALTPNADSASQAMGQKGTLERQVELLKFYADPRYAAQQFFIMMGLASPLFHMTGHAGVVVNAAGDPGASKSTSLYTASAFWGEPQTYPLNGTAHGASQKARAQRMTTMGSLPVCVDEITTMSHKDAQELVMAITQPNGRTILKRDGNERKMTDGGIRSTIMMTTANQSLHGLLAQDNVAGTAGSMRVIEVNMSALNVHTKVEADDYLYELRENYGHIGPVFIDYVIKNYDAVRLRVREVSRWIDTQAKIRGSERFWSGGTACAVVAAEVAQELGLCSFNPAVIRTWIMDMLIPRMRGVVREEYDTPVTVLTNYMETISSQIIVVDQAATGGAVYVKRAPAGSLLGHHDTAGKAMWLLRKGFRDHCARIGANASEIIHALESGDSPIIFASDRRRILGQGTEFEKAQSRCFGVNMAHPEMTGVADLTVVKSTNKAATPIEGRKKRGG